MDNIVGSNNSSGNANTAAGGSEPNKEQHTVEAEKNINSVQPQEQMKRKETPRRSKAWEHFEEIKNSAGVVFQGRCLYYAKKIYCHSKIHGTSSLRNHVLTCMKNPHPKNTRQSLLTLLPVSNNVETKNNESQGSLGTWKFDQEAIRKCLAHMLIVDELPFKFVQREGFKKFLAATCPRFKLPSRWTLTRDCYDVYINERQSLKNFFKDHCQKVSITTDACTSIQRINYI